MSTRFGVSPSDNTGKSAAAAQRRRGLRWMSERQTEAYLIAREALRRVQRSLPQAPSMRTDGQATQSHSNGTTL